jgi:phosphinothricin acetyltransferase
MKESAEPIERAAAAEYATWFRALADATRIQIVSLLARRGSPMNVGDIVSAVDVGQSTVSAHLKVLAEVGFVLAERRGTATYYLINEACVDCFPTAADIVMGHPVPAQPAGVPAARSVAVVTEPGMRVCGADAARIRTEPMTDRHAAEVLAIYQAGMDEGYATFETTAPSWADFRAARLPGHSYVATDAAGTVLGWVAASQVSDRCVYAGILEHSVYVRPDARGRAVGHQLLDQLIRSTERAGIWTIQSGIFPENSASLALHARAGFRTVGFRERIGCHHGWWRDVLLIERRSSAI